MTRPSPSRRGAPAPAGQPAPLFNLALRLEGERSLVVGGGPVAARKVAALAECGSVVTVVAPEICEAVASCGASIARRKYQEADLDGCRLAVAATGLVAVDRQVYEDARRRGVLVNAADDRASSEFFFPAVARFGAVSVAVGTGGLSPYLASWLRARIKDALPDELGLLAELVGKVRAALRKAGLPTTEADWERLVKELEALGKKGRFDEAAGVARAWLCEEIARLSAD